MNNKIKGEKDIKATVLVSYAVILILIALILSFTFSSFQQLTHSSDALAQPNARVGLLHEMIFSIYHAESQIRSYTLNEQESHLDAYFEELEKVNQMVDSLKELALQDTFLLQTIDSINIQLLNKTRLLDQFIHLKKQDRNSIFYEKALDEIIQVTEKENKVREVTHQSILSQIPPFRAEVQAPDPAEGIDSDNLPLELATLATSMDSIPADYTSEQIHQEKVNFFSRVRNLFSGQEDQGFAPASITPNEERKQVERFVQQITTDSIITFYRDTEDLKRVLENTLANLMKTIRANEQKLQKMETSILVEDKMVMDKIWDYVTILQDYESANALKEAGRARATVTTTTEKIFMMVVFSLLFLFIFSLLLIHDVNRSKFYKKQLIHQKSKAEQLVQIKQRFMANLSHEIRTPLNSIIGFSNQLEKSNLQIEHKPYINAINQSSIHLRNIVNDILDFSKIESGKIDLEIIPIDLIEIIDEVYNTLSIISQEKDLEFKVDTRNLKHRHLLGDPLRIKQVLLNVAGNAIKFTNEGSIQIIVSDYIKKENPNLNYVHIRIADTGIGIPAPDQSSIFDEFVQADNQATRKHKGTGLGLSISKKLVEIMNGNIELFSQVGRGTTFSIHLPLIVSHNSAKESLLAVPDLSEEDIVAKILLIDDDEFNRLLFKSLFNPIKGITLQEADHALRGLAMLNEQKYDLIITDIQMPGISGVDLAKQIRSNPQALNVNTPILACTADITAETIREIRENGIEDYLLKPVDESQLMKKTYKLLMPLRESKPGKPKYIAMGPMHPPPPINGHKLYDLQGLIAFTGNDPNTIAPIIEVFIKDTRLNLQKLDDSLRHNDFEEIFRVVHKMDNMFGLLKAEDALFYLKKLNQLKGNGIVPEQIQEHIVHIIHIGNHLIQALDRDLNNLISGHTPWE